MPNGASRLTVATIPGKKYFKEVPWSERRRGDLLCKSNLKHGVVSLGNNQIIHAPKKHDVVKISNEYFTGRCFRPIAFENVPVNAPDSTTVGAGGYKQTVWNLLKSYGLSDIACSGIMGNMVAESGIDPYCVQGDYLKPNPEQYDRDYVAKVDSGKISRNDFVHHGPGGGGFGLVQFTWHTYKEELYDTAKAQGKSIADPNIQVSIFINQIKKNGVFNKLNKATSVHDASNIMLLDYENPEHQGVNVQNKRAANSQKIYSQFAGTGGGAVNTDTVSTNSQYVLTTDEFNSICKIVATETEGLNSPDAEKALSQLIYDMLTSGRFGGLGSILNNRELFSVPTVTKVSKDTKKIVKGVFCNGEKKWTKWQVYTFLTPESNLSSYKTNDKLYDRIGDVSVLSFWGRKKDSSNIKYIISDTAGTSQSSLNNVFTKHKVKYKAATAKLEHFAEPVLIQTDAIMYDENWKFWTGKEGNTTRLKQARENLNDGERIFGSSFVDESQYSSRGRLVRAFPAYLFCILDDQCQWYDGRKLWTNFYFHKSVVDISVHETNDMPTATATLTVSNIYHNLDKTQGGLSSYSVEEDLKNQAFGSIKTAWYKLTGQVLDLGSPNLTDRMIKLHQVIYDNARLREGARVHLRMGYGSDPLSLAPMINGSISDITLGDQLSIVVTSDGNELIQHITSANEKDTNNGWFGLFGLGEEQEGSDIIAGILCKRQNWINYLISPWFEGSKYSIEHFGLYFNQSAMGTLAWSTAGAGIGTVVAPGIGSLIGAGIGTLAGVLFSSDVSIKDLWNGYAEQYDLLKNIYKANYKREHYIYATPFDADGEKNVVFNQYNMTPWDVFQMCTQTSPEYIVKPSYHQFDSRLYFGLPFWMEKYRYDYLNGVIYEECKASTQMHLLDVTNIIDNQIRVTNRYTNTNVKVMYTRGNTPTSTKVIHSDDTIDYSKQKTGIIDSSITQDALGPDALYEFLGYDIGEESARRMGISNLLYGWQQEYQGQIICTGMPGIKAHDYFMIDDQYSKIYGLAIVREVVHSFGVNTGFTTSVTPGMIGFSTDRESGLIVACQNYLSLLNNFSSFLYTRHQIKDNYEKNLELFSNMTILESQVKSVEYNESTAHTVRDGVHTISSIANTAFGAKGIITTVKNLRNADKLKDAAMAFTTTFNAVKEAKVAVNGFKAVKTAKNIGATISAIRAGSIAAAGTVVPVAGAIIGFLVWTAVDILLGELFDWLENRNVCVLLPLWWEGTVFVSGVKNGKKILLCRDDVTRTDDEEEMANATDYIQENPSEDND